jgi:hypothetical protein
MLVRNADFHVDSMFNPLAPLGGTARRGKAASHRRGHKPAAHKARAHKSHKKARHHKKRHHRR